MTDKGIDTWKLFEQNPISHSAAHHLIAVDELHGTHGYARVSDVARALNITRGSASLTFKALKHRGLVDEDENRFLRLTRAGEDIARAVRSKKHLIQTFLENVLGVDPDTAEVDTCKVEHLISHETAQRLADFIRLLSSNDAAAVSFMSRWRTYTAPCGHDPAECPACSTSCVTVICAEKG